MRRSAKESERGRKRLTPGASRFHRRRQGRLRQKLEAVREVTLKIFMVIALLVIAVGVPYFLFTGYLGVVSSDYFKVEQIDVSGLNLLERDYVIARANLEVGGSIFDLDPPEIEEALRSDPWILQAHVEKSFPSNIEITITEYQPAALYVAGSEWQIVTAEGLPFKTFDALDPVDNLLKLPLITGPQVDELFELETQELLVQAIALYHTYRETRADKVYRLSDIHIDPIVGISLVLDPGIRVYMGTNHFRKRLKRLQIVLDEITKENLLVDYILIDQDDDMDQITVGRDPEFGFANPNHIVSKAY